MIRSFRCAETRLVYEGISRRRFRKFELAARKRLRRLDSATSLMDLAAIRGNRLEALKGDRVGEHSIRINDQWRICFVWREGHAFEVEIVDYH